MVINKQTNKQTVQHRSESRSQLTMSNSCHKQSRDHTTNQVTGGEGKDTDTGTCSNKTQHLVACDQLLLPHLVYTSFLTTLYFFHSGSGSVQSVDNSLTTCC